MILKKSKTGALDDGAKGARLKGVFSKPDAKAPGGKSFWFIKEIDERAVSLRRLDENMLPTGKQTLAPRDSILMDYSLEPELGYKLLTQRVTRGDWYRKQDKNLEAKIEYQQALRIDEENIRANFGLGLSYLALNQLEKARYVFTNIVGMDESFEEEHKHLFNEFGIALRKKKLFDESLKYYLRAAELCPLDENIFLNAARAAFEKGDLDLAFENLKKTLERNPNLPQARAFLGYLRKSGAVPTNPKLAAYFRWASSKPAPATRRFEDDLADPLEREPDDEGDEGDEDDALD